VNCGLALVGNADCFELFWIEALTVKSPIDNAFGVFPDLDRVVFDPTGFRIDLFVFFVRLRYDVPVMVKDHETSSSRPLID
jgi:hypothetical protein